MVNHPGQSPRRRSRTGHLMLCTAALALLLPPAALADKVEDQARAEQSQMTRSIQTALRAFVFIGSRGSGVLISDDGYILTNDHVAGDSPKWRVRTVDGVTRYARLVGTDPYGDIALLKIDGVAGLPFIAFGDSEKAKVGETVIAVGNPFGMSNIDEKPTVTVGLISALHRMQNRMTDAIMTDAAINPGNSGGPLITNQGKLIGINAQIDTRYEVRSNTGIGYAISVNQVKNFMAALKAADGGLVQHGGKNFLGRERAVKLKRSSNPPEIEAVTADSVPAKAGLVVGDKIARIDGIALRSPVGLLKRLLTYPAGAKVTLTLEREGKSREVELELAGIGFPTHAADLGVSFLDVGDKANRLVVTKVNPGSLADKAGMKVGDLFDSIMGITWYGRPSKELQAALKKLIGDIARQGAFVEVTVLREGKPVQLALEIPRSTARPRTGFHLGPPENKVEDAPELRVHQVRPGSAAERAGIQPGDIILGLGETRLTKRLEYARAVVGLRPSAKVKVLIKRGDAEKAVDVVMGLKREMP